MLKTAYLQKGLITAVCASQRINLLVQSIMLTSLNWVLLQEVLELFAIFVYTTKKLQGLLYLTLNYTIPQYYIMIKKLKEKRSKWGNLLISLALKEALDKLNEYYNNLNAYAHLSIATICDLWFNYSLFSRLLPESTENHKRAKILTNFKNCFAEYKDR